MTPDGERRVVARVASRGCGFGGWSCHSDRRRAGGILSPSMTQVLRTGDLLSRFRIVAPIGSGGWGRSTRRWTIRWSVRSRSRSSRRRSPAPLPRCTQFYDRARARGWRPDGRNLRLQSGTPPSCDFRDDAPGGSVIRREASDPFESGSRRPTRRSLIQPAPDRGPARLRTCGPPPFRSPNQ